MDADQDEGWQMMCGSDGDSREVRLHAGLWTAQMTATFSSSGAQPLPSSSLPQLLAVGTQWSSRIPCTAPAPSHPNPPARTRLLSARCPLLCACQGGWGARQKHCRSEVCLEIRPCLCLS